MHQTAEVPVSLPSAAAQIRLPGERSCGSGALRDSQVRFRAEGV